MAIETQFTSQQRTRSRGSTGGVTAQGELASNYISIKHDTQRSKKDRKAIVDIVEVLLGVDKLIEGGDAVMAQEMMIGSSVQTRTWASNVVDSRSLEGVCSVSISWDFDASLASARKAVPRS